MNQYNPWSQEAIAELTRLHGLKLLFSAIAEQMRDAGFRVTRNACIGKARRLKLPTREVFKFPPRAKTRPSCAPGGKRRRDRRGGRPMPDEPVIFFPSERKHCNGRTGLLIDLDQDQCRWPVEEIGHATYLYCTADKDGFGSYCRKHRRIAHNPVRGER